MSVETLFDLSGKTALVTGCKRGIGRSMAVALARAGADIIGVSATLETSGSAVERDVAALGPVLSRDMPATFPANRPFWLLQSRSRARPEGLTCW